MGEERGGRATMEEIVEVAAIEEVVTVNEMEEPMVVPIGDGGGRRGKVGVRKG